MPSVALGHRAPSGQHDGQAAEFASTKGRLEIRELVVESALAGGVRGSLGGRGYMPAGAGSTHHHPTFTRGERFCGIKG